MPNEQINALDAVDILNDFMGDLSAGVGVFREYREHCRRGRLHLQLMVPIQKMCFSHIILTLAKWLEFYDHYHHIIPDRYRDVCKDLNKTIRGKGIPAFRNIIVGHIWDKKLKRPLVLSEVMSRLESIIGGHADTFLNWVYDPSGTTSPTVFSTAETIRDVLVKKYNISPKSAIER